MGIFKASKTGDIYEVIRLIEEGVDVNIKNVNQQTPLILATKHGHLEVVAYLLKQKPDINYQDENKNTALILACIAGNLEIVKLLVEHGADVSIKNYQAAALWYAFQKDFLDITKYLIRHGTKFDEFTKGLLLSRMNNRKDKMYLLSLCYGIFPSEKIKKRKFEVNFKNAC